MAYAYIDNLPMRFVSASFLLSVIVADCMTQFSMLMQKKYAKGSVVLRMCGTAT